MPTHVLLLVVFAAFLHASWNAVVKSSPDKFLDIVFVTASAALVGAVALPFLSMPAPASWPYAAASAVIHIAYFLLIGAAYRSGDMSHAYPLMRGTPPLIVTVVSVLVLGERLSVGEWSGIVLICAGILAMLMVNASSLGTGRTTQLALLNALAVAAYTLVDGTGGRLSGNPASYTMWVFVLTGPPILIWALIRGHRQAIRHLDSRWHFALAGGVCTLSAYTLVVWAMNQAPIALVAALRETAILFGTAISILVFKERQGSGRPIAAVLILLGVITLKLA